MRTVRCNRNSGKPAVINFVHDLRYNKVCAHWVSGVPTKDHKEARKVDCTELLQRYENQGDAFVSSIVAQLVKHECTITTKK
jgi:hypothetical protein